MIGALDRIATLERENAALREELAAWRTRDEAFRRDEIAAARLVKLRNLTALDGPNGAGAARLLLALIDRSPEVVGRERLLGLVARDPSEPPDAQIVRVLVCRARKALARAGHPAEALATIWGEGYRLRPDVARDLRRRLGEAKAESPVCNGDPT